MAELKKESSIKDALLEINNKLDNLSINSRNELSYELEDKIPILEGAIKIHQRNYTELLKRVEQLDNDIKDIKEGMTKPKTGKFFNSTNLPVLDEPKDLDHYFDTEEEELPKSLSIKKR